MTEISIENFLFFQGWNFKDLHNRKWRKNDFYYHLQCDILIIYGEACIHITCDYIHYTSEINGLMQERCNSIVNALELHLSCINPSQWPVHISLYVISSCSAFKIISFSMMLTGYNCSDLHVGYIVRFILMMQFFWHCRPLLHLHQ